MANFYSTARSALLALLLAAVFLPPTPVQAASAAPVHFSRLSGTFADNFDLSLTSIAADAVIRYTVNGSVPTDASALYIGPISITNSVQVRAKNFQPGLPPSETTGESYLKLDASLLNFKSDLPLMVLDNFKKGTVPSINAQPAFFALFDRVNGFSAPMNPPVIATRAGIRIRGSSTQDQPKHNYALETWDEENQDKKIEPLGLPADSDWILYAPYNFDRANMRNPFIYEISNQAGRYAVRTRFVELFINTTGGPLSYTHYNGIYVFMEKIKRGPKRIAIQELTTADTSEPNVSGGYMLKVDRLDPGDRGFTAGAQLLGFVEPKEKEILTVQSNWIKGYIGAFGTALNSATGTDPVKGYARYIDVDAWIDHHLLNEFTKNPDGLVLSTYLHKDRNRRLAYGPIWDFDRTMGCDDDSRAASPIGWSGNFNYSWWGRLFNDPNYFQRYIDRWAELRRGPMTVTNMLHIIDTMAAEIQQAEPRDATRWKMVSSLAGWRVKVDSFKTWVTRRAAWIDSQWIPAPELSRTGGILEPEGASIEIATGATNSIYYTLDGTDPRLPGGGISATAKRFFPGDPPIRITGPAHLVARSKNGRTKNPWSAPSIAFFIEEQLPHLAFTEVMYNPLPSPVPSGYDAQDYEFIELQNLGSKAFNLAGCELSGGVDFRFPDYVLPPGETVIVAGDLAAFSSRYGTRPNALGDYLGRLNNTGETLALKDASGRTLASAAYDSSGAWPKSADGKGNSLELKTIEGDPALPASWKASAIEGGSPGTTSFARIELFRDTSDPALPRVRFHKLPGKSYVIQYRETLDAGQWRTLKSIPASNTDETIELPDPAAGITRYYRLVMQ